MKDNAYSIKIWQQLVLSQNILEFRLKASE